MTPVQTPLMDHPIVTVGDADDARDAARTPHEYGPDEIPAANVIEMGEVAPDKKPLDPSEEIASCRDMDAAIIETVADVGASVIAYSPRAGSRVTQFVAGDRALRRVTVTDRPVISLLDPEDG